MIALPENVSYIGSKDGAFINAETVPGELTELFQRRLKSIRYGLTAEASGEYSRETKLYNTSLMFNPAGEIAARYEKFTYI